MSTVCITLCKVQHDYLAETLIYIYLSLLQQGMVKSFFVNDVTMAAHKSVQVVD